MIHEITEESIKQAKIETSFFAPGPHAIQGTLHTTGKCKIYNMAKEYGIPNVIVESTWGQAVIVIYAPTGQTYSWEWKHRNEAWDWAKSRRDHINIIKGGGRRYVRY